MTVVRAVRWTVRAQRDLDLIQEQIAFNAPQAAENMRRRLVEATDSLSGFPDIGRAHGETRLIVTVRPYVIRYRVRPEAGVIIGVRHGARRPR
jgi:plasmid stabilization system protein ParE